MNLRILTYEQALSLPRFILPGVLERAEASRFWYLSAFEERCGFLGLAVVDPRVPQPALLSIGVAKESVRQGIGSRLLQFAGGLLERAGADSIRTVYAAEPADWEALDPFLRGNGFRQTEPEHHSYVITLGEIAGKRLLREAGKNADRGVTAVADLTERTLRTFRGQVARTGQFEPEALDACDPRHSFAWLEEGEVRALFLLSPVKDGEMHNLWTWLSPKAGDLRALQKLFARAAQRTLPEYPPDTAVHVPCLSASSERMLRYFLPEADAAQSLRIYSCPIGTRKES